MPITLPFLRNCRIYSGAFRQRIVTDETYHTISDDLFQVGYDYSKKQLREKMRNLKRAFTEAKEGKYQRSVWQNFQDMSYINEPFL